MLEHVDQADHRPCRHTALTRWHGEHGISHRTVTLHRLLTKHVGFCRRLDFFFSDIIFVALAFTAAAGTGTATFIRSEGDFLPPIMAASFS